MPAPEAAPQTRAEAFEVQARMVEILGERPVGWKVGAAVPAVQVMDGHDGPIVGRLLASRHLSSPATLPAERYRNCKIESEIAFRFTADVVPRARPYTKAELEPLLVLHAGLEVAGSRYPANSPVRPTTRDLIADNGVCAAYVVSPGVEDWRQIDFATLPVVARIGSGEPLLRFTGEYYRDPVDILLETVNGISARGLTVHAGDLLTTGSLTLPVPLESGQTYVSQFGDWATLSLTMR